MGGQFRNLLLATSALVPIVLVSALANPLGGQVIGGSANIQGQGTSQVTVTQSTNRAIINWNTFNIGAGEKTQFIQPNSSSIALNRVTGGLGPSQLYGTLTANGRIFLVNPDGILVGPGAKIDTAGFLATTNNIKNEDFMAGRYNFTIPGRPDASIVNLGSITASGQGFAALVAPGVRNSGTITATLGKISLASGNTFALDLYGDSLIKLAVSDSVAAQVKDVATGQPLRSLISNDGKLFANGGRVELSAVSARQLVDSVINNTGVIEANSIGMQNGKIVLMTQTAATKLAGTPTQTVKVSGLLSAAGQNSGEAGGTIQVTGENIVLANAWIDAAGDAGGGKVLIGGDWGGGRPSTYVFNQSAKLESNLIPTATSVSVDAGTIIDASAMRIGDGGKVIVWADGSTDFAGIILARGGLLTGNGGFVETSGYQTLTFSGVVYASAPNGVPGILLLDPAGVSITFQELGIPAGQTYVEGLGISADGATIVGFMQSAVSQAYRWTAATGVAGLGFLPGHSSSQAYQVSGDGSIVVGCSGPCGNFKSGERAFRWTQATGMLSLGTLPGGTWSWGWDISSDGLVIVGTSGSATYLGEAFRWTQATGMVGLGVLPGHTVSTGYAVSANGNVVVGCSGVAASGQCVQSPVTSSQAMRWTSATGMVGLGFLPGGNHSGAFATNADGSVVVGSSNGTAYPAYGAFRWTLATGMVALGTLPGHDRSTAYGVSADGSLVVGYSATPTEQHTAYRWTQTTGMQSISSILLAGGINLVGWNLTEAYGVSANGQVIAGSGVDSLGRVQGWIVQFASAPPSGGSSASAPYTLTNLGNYYYLTATSPTQAGYGQPNVSTTLLINQSSPLSAASILDSAGLSYLTEPAISDLLSMLLAQIPLNYLSTVDRTMLRDWIAQALKTEIVNRNLTRADIVAMPVDYFAGLAVDAFADVITNKLTGKAPPIAIALARYGVEIIGNSSWATYRTGNIRAGVTVGIIQTTAGEVVAAFKTGTQWWLDIKEAKEQIKKINQLIADTEAAAQIAKAAGDHDKYQKLMNVERGLWAVWGALGEFVATGGFF